MNYQIEEWLIEPKQLRISKEGNKRSLEPRVMAVLLALIEDAPNPLSREEIERAVWGNIHVSETLVRRAISALRAAFEDDARNPRFIETIPRRGYALKAVPMALDANTLEARKNPAFHRIMAGEAKRVMTQKAMKRLLIGSVLVIFSLVFFSRFSMKSEDILANQILKVPAGGYLLSPGVKVGTFPEMRRDGSEKVFVGRNVLGEEELYRYWGLDPDNTRAFQLTSDGGQKVGLSFSPNGKYLAYGLLEKNGASYVRVLRWGDETRTVFKGNGHLTDVVWLDETTLLIAYAKSYGNDDFRGISKIYKIDFDPEKRWDVPLELLEIEPLTKPMLAHFGDLLPRPDGTGKRLAFVREFSRGIGDIFVQEGVLPERKLTALRGTFGGLDWSDDGRWLYFSIYEGGRYVLKRVSFASNEVEHVPFNHPVRRFVVSGNHLLFEHYREVTEIYRGNIERQSRPRAFIANGSWDSMPRYSWSGDRIALVSTRAGNRDIWLVDKDGGNLRQLTSWGGAMVHNPAWSRDDQRLAFEVREGKWTHIYEMDLEEGIPVQMSHGQVTDGLPFYGPKGEWLYYSRQRSEVAWEMRRMRLDRSYDQTLTPLPQRAYHLDGGMNGMFMTKSATGVVYRFGFDGTMLEVFSGTGLDVTNWMMHNTELYYVMRSSEGVQLNRFDTVSEQVTTVRDLDGFILPHSFAVSPTDPYYLFAKKNGFLSDILVMPIER